MSEQHDGSDGLAGLSWPSLREVRAERLLSIRDLAQLANVAPSTVYLIEAGRTAPQPGVIRRLATALEVDPHTVAELRRAIRHRGGLR